ncbi:MAG TPA: tartrate dehydrogenase [Rhodocyclaceae bacterium]|nr:MAG: tartrate dehydrogenase [Betaproteobacteria bacterium CG2_30_68_42]PIX76220.1 MAG: tartrate dehydrogenase [Rhodocyclales bacterium CG_4_10_14_3_um_filter_68_10]PJA56545.1 MAG: tartrate dehydrogenase [Rhodocyclales bacterium CG_4_9_14_3_um_filter_68_10]HCX34932.1 tartrate dehydrogenase [Rhodocyclaceae bacterium]
MATNHRIATIPGDGIGREVVPEGVRVLDAVAAKFDIAFAWDWIEWANCDYYRAHGQMMPEDWFERIRGHDAILFGAVGWPQTVPDHVSLWGSLLQFRRRFDQYINLRPVRLMPGMRCPLAGRRPGDIDFVVVRENTEGEYSSIGGRMFEGTEREVVLQETVMTRTGVDRVLKYAFELAARRGRHLTSATKSNGIAITMPFWDERVEAMAAGFPQVRTDRYHIDILCAHFVQHPDWFDVVVASNLFGDILSDLGPACTGTIGIAPSANINPERTFPSLFEPVHGSAPDIAGRGIANPLGQIWSGALMLEHLGHAEAAQAVVRAIEAVLESGPKTPDLGGTATTAEVGRAVAQAV